MKKYFISAIMAIASVVSVNAQSNGFNSLFTTTSPSVSSVNIPTSVNSNVRYQSGYVRSNGTYVSGHMKTVSNNTNWDNFSTRSNTNPFTGTVGTRARDYSADAFNYGSGRTIYTGSRGGQYYINSNGNKTYVPKRW